MKVPLPLARVAALALAAAATALPGTAAAHGSSSEAVARTDKASIDRLVAEWQQPSRMAAMDMIQKYGPPQETTPSMLLWRNNGPWKWTKVSRETVPHNFPVSHLDLLEQAIDYRVPMDMFDELARFDGSVIAERTKGQLSARCDKEGANFLAINLAHDVATGRRGVDEARSYYAAAMKKFVASKQEDPYMQRLQFEPPSDGAGDPDQAAM